MLLKFKIKKNERLASYLLANNYILISNLYLRMKYLIGNLPITQNMMNALFPGY